MYLRVISLIPQRMAQTLRSASAARYEPPTSAKPTAKTNIDNRAEGKVQDLEELHTEVGHEEPTVSELRGLQYCHNRIVYEILGAYTGI